MRKIVAGPPTDLYLARDPALQRRLSLKLLHAEINYEREAAGLLEREARLLARINHPNVASVFDLGRFGAELCMTLEEVGRHDLLEWRKRHRPSREELRSAIEQGARGLAAAHAAGVVHGALSPRHLRVDSRGAVRLVGFEQAHDLAPEPGAWEMGEPKFSGDLDYMAPETRVQGRRDPLSDQFSFCAIAWELLSGRRPPHDPRRTAMGSTMRSVAAYRVLARGLSESPTERWPDMDQLVDALGSSHPPRRARLITAAMVLALAVATAGLFASGSCTMDAPDAGKSQDQVRR